MADSSGTGTATSSLREHLDMVRRRKWIILQALLIVPAAAVALSLRQGELYEASSDVLLSTHSVVSSVTGMPDPSSAQPDRVANTQADLARVPALAARVLRAAGLEHRSVGSFLANSSVALKPNTDLLVFRVRDPDPQIAKRLSSEYGRQFTLFKHNLDTSSVKRARGEVEASLAELEAADKEGTPLYESLLEKDQQLRTYEALQTPNVLVRPATGAVRVQPRPVRAGLIGLAVALVLGLGLALLREALDTRIRTAEEVGERLRLPLLARLPAPSRGLRRRNHLVMLAQPTSPGAEAFRVLRANIEFARLERNVRTVMVTSSLEGEGKTTTVANLAVALARAGRRVLLVDLDLRRPSVDKYFGLHGWPGISDVALGQTTLDEAIVPIPIGDAEPVLLNRNGNGGAPRHRAGNGNGSANGGAAPQNVLEVLASGPIPANAGEFVGMPTISKILGALHDRADIVLVDAPPLLQVGDAMALTAEVDGLVVVTSLSVLRRPTIKELHRVLGACPTAKLGFVLTGADLEEGDGYDGRFHAHPRFEVPAIR